VSEDDVSELEVVVLEPERGRFEQPPARIHEGVDLGLAIEAERALRERVHDALVLPSPALLPFVPRNRWGVRMDDPELLPGEPPGACLPVGREIGDDLLPRSAVDVA